VEIAKDHSWYKFWDERGRSHPDDDPIAIDGWDYGISMMGTDEADELREQFSLELGLTRQSKFLEVGCGAGMYLLPLSKEIEYTIGCDLAESMLKRARQLNEQISLQVSEASYLPYASNLFDAILVYSVFHYFPSEEYARRVLNELHRVCQMGGKIWLGDIPEKSKKKQALAHRERLMQQSTPKWAWPKVGPLEQRFYDREFFIRFAENVRCDYRFVEQSVKGYIQGRYRFNVLLQK